MKPLQFLTVLTVATFQISCGPNAEQRAAMQKQHDDSIAHAVAQVQKQKYHDDSIAQVAAQNARQAQEQMDADAEQAKQQREVAIENLKSYQQQLENYRADLSAAYTKMTEIKSEDCWLQSCKDAKVQKVRNETLVIEHINDIITSVQNKISDIKTKYNIQ